MAEPVDEMLLSARRSKAIALDIVKAMSGNNPGELATALVTVLAALIKRAGLNADRVIGGLRISLRHVAPEVGDPEPTPPIAPRWVECPAVPRLRVDHEHQLEAGRHLFAVVWPAYERPGFLWEVRCRGDLGSLPVAWDPEHATHESVEAAKAVAEVKLRELLLAALEAIGG